MRRSKDPCEMDKLVDGRIPPHLIIDLGRSLFGAYWQRPFAKAMNITERSLHRWSNDGCPSSFLPALRKLLSERVADAGRLQSIITAIE